MDELLHLLGRALYAGLLLILALVVLTVLAYFTTKAATMAYLRARMLFEQRNPNQNGKTKEKTIS